MYNPSLHTATNKPIGITNKPVDARTYYYDTATFAYRPYASTSEVLGYLIGDNRVGYFSIIVGTEEYWFKGGIADVNLVKKSGVIPPYVLTLNTTKSAPYTLSSPELAQVNAFGKYPNFVSLIGGEVYNDITVRYFGTPGSFTQVQILLHTSDGGMNLETTIVQFS